MAVVSAVSSLGCQRDCLVELTIERGDLGSEMVSLDTTVNAQEVVTGEHLWGTYNSYDAVAFFAEPGVTNRLLLTNIPDDVGSFHIKSHAKDLNGSSIGFGNADAECAPGLVEATLTLAAFVCGNDAREGEEECDGLDLLGNTCDTFGFEGGTLDCSGTCDWDFTGCNLPVDCNNGVLDVGEDCEGMDLGGQTCEGLGFMGGEISCGPACSYDLMYCWN